MIYLESFQLPIADWVDWYFSPPSLECVEYSEKMLKLWTTLKERFPTRIPEANRMSGFTTWYPWQIFYQRGEDMFTFGDITILYGGNGSGKTTLLNVIAQKLKLHRSTLYNRSSFFDDYLKFGDSFLGRNEKSQLAIQKGCIITSDDVFDNILKKREENQNIDHQRSLLVEQYFGRTVKKRKILLVRNMCVVNYRIIRENNRMGRQPLIFL